LRNDWCSELPIPMNVPNNVLWFQVLLYMSLMLDAVSVAFADRTPSPEITEAMITANTLLNGGVILLLFYFVHLAARRRKNWPRLVLAAVLLLSVVSLVYAIWTSGLELDSAIEIVSCVLTALGLYFSMTGDAKGWFNA
jgi:heme/copper-type cytochrome/quinol oxidase subunit 4